MKVSPRTAFTSSLKAKWRSHPPPEKNPATSSRPPRPVTGWPEHSKPHEENTSTVIRQVQTLADLVTVKCVVEKVAILDVPPDSTLGQFVQGDNRVLLLAHGVVKAGIDLKHLTPADVSV